MTDYKGHDLISQKIKDNLGLEKSPVAIKFVLNGSRQYADIKEDEVIVGLNGENIGFVVNAMENMI